MLAALDLYLKEHNYKYSIIRDREFHQSKLVLEGKVKCLRQQETQRRERTHSRGGRNAMESAKSRQLQSKGSFPNYVVDLDSTFRPEGKTGTPFNGRLQFLCGRQWH